MNDATISRQTAIDKTHERIFQEIIVEYPSYTIYPEYKGKPYFSIKYTENGQEFIGYSTYKPEVLSEFLKEYFMPPAQSEPQWIPCSERLPEDGIIVIMTVRYISETSYLPPFVDSGYISKGKWYSVSGEDFSKVIADVIAWMPLPEPYKGEES